LKVKYNFIFVVTFIVLFLFFITENNKGAAKLTDSYSQRIAGAGRYETAVEIAKQGWPSGATAVILARGDLFPDALAGAPLAFKMDAPILLTTQKQLPSVTKNEIKKLNAKKVYILGGPKAIEFRVEKELKEMGLTVERIYGNDRYETAVEIAKRLGSSKDEVIVATGVDFPDALAVASYAAANNAPILLTKPDTLPTKVANYVLGAKKTYIIGGLKAINSDVEKKLPNAKRLAGKSRYDTAIEILSYFYSRNPKLYISTGSNFADALTGSVLAAKNHTGILLVDKNKPVGDVDFLISSNQVETFSILGGQSAVSDLVAESLSTSIHSYSGSIGAAKVSPKLNKATTSQIQVFEQAIKSMNSNGTLSFTVKPSVASNFKIGQLILFPPMEKQPNGFIAKVLSVNTSTGKITFGQPALEDIFTKLIINKKDIVSVQNIKHFALNNGVSLKLNNQQITNLSEWNDFIRYSNPEILKSAPLVLYFSSAVVEKTLPDGTKDQIRVNGSIELQDTEAMISTKYHSSNGLSDLTVDFKSELMTNIQVEYDWNGNIDHPSSTFNHDWTTVAGTDLGNAFLLGTITYHLGNIPFFGLDNGDPIEIPVGLTVIFTTNHIGEVTANASITLIDHGQYQNKVQWDQGSKSFSYSKNVQHNRYQLTIEGSGEGKITNNSGIATSIQIGSLLPIDLQHYNSINTTIKGSGKTSIDLKTGTTIESNGCLSSTLKVIEGNQIRARLKTLSYDLTKGNSFIKNLGFETIIDKSYDDCTNSGIITGIIKNAKSGTVLSNVSVKAYKDGVFQVSTTSSTDGSYQLKLPEGNYTLTFSKDGYQTEKIENVLIIKNSMLTAPTIPLTNLADKGTGTISGQIQDAVTGQILPGATIQIRKGYQAKTGDIVASVTTDQKGKYTISNFPSGLYTAEVIKDGYIPYTFNIRCVKGWSIGNQNGALSPLLGEGKTRMVLTWGNQPDDLDAHLTGPGVGEERFHLFWDTKEYYEDNQLIASLNGADARNAFGPETITIHQQKPGIYRFSVFNYSYRLHEGSTALANSDAKVDLYKGNMHVQTYYVPTTASGKLWTVFEINGNTITPVNLVNDGYSFSIHSSTQIVDKELLTSLEIEKPQK
jgi:putative cell wall-binding protein